MVTDLTILYTKFKDKQSIYNCSTIKLNFNLTQNIPLIGLLLLIRPNNRIVQMLQHQVKNKTTKTTISRIKRLNHESKSCFIQRFQIRL